MITAPYITQLRERIGSDLLLVPSVAALIYNEEGKLLFQRKAGSEGWSLPAGAIEPGENPEEALRREVMEETGLCIKTAILVDAFSGSEFRHTYPNGDKVEYTVLVYRCEVNDEKLTPTDNETLDLAYFNEASAPSIALPYPSDILFPQNTPR